MAMRVEYNPLEAALAALLANGLDGAGEALRILVNEASKIERARFLHATPHERTEARTDYANGFKPKTVMTRLGEQTFDVPQVRGGGFYPSALEKGSRTEQALNLALAERYVQGVSTRKVCDSLVKLLGPEVSLSSTQVSRAAERLDLAQWAEENLPEGFAVFDLPHSQRTRLRTTNGLERINREIKRRTRVASIFPNTASCLRLVSALWSGRKRA